MMKVKQILGITLAAAVSMGAVLGSGMPVYAAAEDWLRFDANSDGSKQPDPLDEEGWKMSYGYTIHSNYKYILRYCTEDTRMWEKNADGYGYDVFTYLAPMKVRASLYDSTLVDREPETQVWLTIPFSFEDAEHVLREKDDELNKASHSVPEGEALIVYGYDVGHKWEDVMATGSIMVYDQNNNLVDSFPLQVQPASNTNPTVPVAEPANPTPAAANPVDTAVGTDPAEAATVMDTVVATAPAEDMIQPVQASNNSVSVEEVAAEVLKGKWGVGNERRVRLEAAGYDYMEVQKEIAALMK